MQYTYIFLHSVWESTSTALAGKDPPPTKVLPCPLWEQKPAVHLSCKVYLPRYQNVFKFTKGLFVFLTASHPPSKAKGVCGSASLSLWISMSFWGKFQLFNIFRFDFDDKASSGLKHFPSAGFNEIYIWIQECWCCLNGNNANASQNITSRIYTIHKIDNS